MRAALFTGNGHIETTELRSPNPAPGEVLVRVSNCALCGSDLKLFRHGAAITPGHEILGTVEAAGHRLHGRRVLVYIPVHCGTCASCRAGDTHLCDTVSTLIGWNRPGGYAEALAVPENCLLEVPDDIDDALAPLLLDTIGTAAHAIRLAKPVLRAAGPVLVLGAGPIGLGAILAARSLGFTDIAVAEPRARRHAAALALGARASDPKETRRFALVLESSGHPDARQAGLEAVAPGGVVALIGENDSPWPFTETKSVRRKDFWMLRSFYFPLSDYATNVDLLRARTEEYRMLVDATCDLPGLESCFAAFAEGALLKPLLVF